MNKTIKAQFWEAKTRVELNKSADLSDIMRGTKQKRGRMWSVLEEYRKNLNHEWMVGMMNMKQYSDAIGVYVVIADAWEHFVIV